MNKSKLEIIGMIERIRDDSIELFYAIEYLEELIKEELTK